MYGRYKCIIMEIQKKRNGRFFQSSRQFFAQYVNFYLAPIRQCECPCGKEQKKRVALRKRVSEESQRKRQAMDKLRATQRDS